MARIKTGGPPQKKKALDPAAVAKAVAAGPRGIDSGMLLNQIIASFGGASGFVGKLKAEWDDSKPGSMARKTIIDIISRLTIVVTTQEIAKPRRAEDLDDEELMDAATALMVRMQNGPASPAPAEA